MYSPSLKESLSYCLLVTSAAYGSQQATNAWLFANTLIMTGHILKMVFFYREGVYNGNQLISPASDEFNLLMAWKRLARETGCQLNICVSSGLRRGIIDANEAKNIGLHCANLDKDFVLTGLVSLAEAILLYDRIIQF